MTTTSSSPPPTCIVCGRIIPTVYVPLGPHGPYHQDCSGEVIWQPPEREATPTAIPMELRASPPDVPMERVQTAMGARTEALVKAILHKELGTTSLTTERFQSLVDALVKAFLP